MTHTEPGGGAPLPTTTVDFAAIYARQAESEARATALRPENKERLFDAMTAAGITHVTVTFDGSGDSGQVESIGAWCGEAAAAFPAVEIQFAALTWDNPAVEMRSLTLLAVVEEMAYDYLADTHAAGKTMTVLTASSVSMPLRERSTSISTSASPRMNPTIMNSDGEAEHGTSLSPRPLLREKMGRHH